LSYHGNVTVGGVPDVRELAALMITKLAVGPYDNNTYLLRCRYTGEQLLIDAAAESNTLLKVINNSLATVVTTHQHGDHWQALSDVIDATKARTAAGRYDAPAIPVPTDMLLDDGDTIEVGQVSLRAIHLVGHTPGSIALLYDDPKGHPHLFTGDCLFPGGVGNTQKDPERFTSLYSGVMGKIFNVLPDETWVYPGHGRDTTLGAERPHLAEWKARGW
jgi:glyoxylase-like metal-dependent hydrolase (beta-lactamase superfamily II)